MTLSQDGTAAKDMSWSNSAPAEGPSLGWDPCVPDDHPVKKLCLRESSSSPRAGLTLGQDSEGCALGCPDASNPPPPSAQQGEEAQQGGEVAQEASDDEACAGASGSSLDCLGEDLLLHVLRLAQPTAWDLCRMVSQGTRTIQTRGPRLRPADSVLLPLPREGTGSPYMSPTFSWHGSSLQTHPEGTLHGPCACCEDPLLPLPLGVHPCFPLGLTHRRFPSCLLLLGIPGLRRA